MRIEEDFFQRDALEIAPLLLGMRICRRMPDGSVLSSRILETEIYRGEEDLGCHASKGKTKRNQMMYEKGGHAYIYLIYGLHWLFNIVTGEKDAPQAVLIRALEKPWDGPAKWTRAFSLTGEQNGIYLPHSQEIWLEAGNPLPCTTAPRVGIDYAKEPWKSMPWRLIATEGGK